MTSNDLRVWLNVAGLNAWTWPFPDQDYESCSAEFVRENWAAWVAARPEALCLSRELGGGKTVRVPRWVAEAGDCDNLALSTMVWADTGNALAAVTRGERRGGLAYGVLFYAAEVREGNYRIAGPHAINWFVDYSGGVNFFEPGLGEMVTLTPTERSSSWFGLAA